WTKLLEHPASRLMTDPEDPLIAYAVTTAGIYESVAFDSEHWGLTWRSSGGYGPPLPVVHYHVLGDSDGALFIAQDERNTLWTSRPGCDAWRNLSRPFGGRYDFARIAGAGNTLAAFAPGASTIAVSTDGGVNWTPKGRQIYWYGRNAGLAAVDVNDVAVDPRDPNTLYVAGPRNVWVSRDLGDSWQPSNEGLAIPAVSALAADPATGAVYAGTPGGLYESRDAGATWRPSNLVPMFEGLNLIETSPVDYLESYWMARCHGFITVEQAKASWEEEAPRKEE
ncbi:MAG TPA: hypothetical protein HPP77_09910, partial [Candidatus Hydrogenedentes bacterium]|nr:hypothetical protein [Candidatus Hydrogenedentota bacterium]